LSKEFCGLRRFALGKSGKQWLDKLSLLSEENSKAVCKNKLGCCFFAISQNLFARGLEMENKTRNQALDEHGLIQSALHFKTPIMSAN
jgi:hypothetical protein